MLILRLPLSGGTNTCEWHAAWPVTAGTQVPVCRQRPAVCRMQQSHGHAAHRSLCGPDVVVVHEYMFAFTLAWSQARSAIKPIRRMRVVVLAVGFCLVVAEQPAGELGAIVSYLVLIPSKPRQGLASAGDSDGKVVD